MNKTIEIKCTGSTTLDFKDITEFQGNFKFRQASDIDKIIKSIETYGFSFPFFIWQSGKLNYCLDGHGRLAAMKELQKRGYELPKFPVVYVEAKDEGEAKQKLLRMNSIYGNITAEGVLEFLNGIEVDFNEIALPSGELIMGINTNFNAMDEWKDMPEFVQNDQVFRKIAVSFNTQEDVDAFAKLIGQEITDKTRFIWYPRAERLEQSTFRCASNES
jgi:hypothetical protein